MSKVLDGGFTEGTFLGIDGDPIVHQEGEELPEVLLVGRHIRAGDKYIVQIYKSKVDIPEHPVHETLKCLRSVFKPKGHSQKLKESERRYNCRLGDIIFGHGIW